MTDPKNMESTFTVGRDQWQTVRRRVLVGYQETYRRELVGWQLDWNLLNISAAYAGAYSGIGAYAGAFAGAYAGGLASYLAYIMGYGYLV